MLEFAGEATRMKAPHLTHPHLCLDAIKQGVERGGLIGLRRVIPSSQISSQPLERTDPSLSFRNTMTN